MKTSLSVPVLIMLIVLGPFVQAQQMLYVSPCHSDSEVIALVDTVLLGNIPDDYKQNITFNGDFRAVGYFTDGYILNFENSSGIVMTTGYAESVDESNICNTLSNASSNNNGSGNDPDLAELGGGVVFDASIVEFDILLTGDSMRLSYVFGSEEYHEYVNTSFNDVFGFFLSGDDIYGQYTNNADIISLIPSSDQFVSINSINFGQGGRTCTGKPPECHHCEYLVDNSQATNSGFNQLVFDAYTTPLTATHYVTKNNWYHVKIAISDIADFVFDTGVFMERDFLRQYTITGNNTTEQNNIKVYPNPCTDMLTIGNLQENTSIILRKINGEFIYHIKNAKEKQTLSLKDLPKGLYILELHTQKHITIEKVIYY